MPFNIPFGGAAMMIKHVCLAIILLLVSFADSSDTVWGQDRSADQPAQPSAAALRLVVISDDDFLAAQQDLWCARSLARAVETFHRIRPGAKLTLDSRAAGYPAILRGSRPRSGPRRAIALLCDREGEIAAFCVGVPTGPQLVAMAEDADDVSIFRLAESLPQAAAREGDEEPVDSVLAALQQRSHRRVLRHYKPLLAKIDRQMSPTAAAALLLPALVADRGERFLIGGPPDTLRWLSAQQHAETMRHWCEAMLPSLVGKRVESVWPELAGVLWEGQPWMLSAADADLVSWYTQAIASGPVVLSLDAAAPLVDQPIAAVTAAAGKRAPAAARAEALQSQRDRLLAEANHRSVSMAAVATLMHHRRDKAVDLLGNPEAFGGWVVFDAKGSPPDFIPARLQRRLIEMLEN